ncbi:MAG TPA: LuxR C-terminal-related transcriptional regulator [Mycobacterium sp.]|nr:LuxR C-terminal-related transcriptional regulator [Mycobacterium sp.]
MIAARSAAEKGLDLADVIGDRIDARHCRYCLGTAQQLQGELASAVAQFDMVAAESDAAHDVLRKGLSLGQTGFARAYQGDTGAARTAVGAALAAAAEIGEGFTGFAHLAAAVTELAAGDVAAARDASEAARQHLSVAPGLAAVQSAYYAQAALAAGDLGEARRRADHAVTTTTGWYLVMALTTRARVAVGQGDLDQAEHDAHDALVRGPALKAYLGIPDILEILAAVAVEAGNHRDAARLYGAAQSTWQRMGATRFKVWDGDYQASVTVLREAMDEQEFDDAWAEGAGLSTEEAITYAQRGRGQRKRPSTGWDSLTPAERDVVRLVSDGLSNKDIGARLFVSPRTVQAHLTHVYTKLGLTSRIQLAQEAARHG